MLRTSSARDSRLSIVVPFHQNLRHLRRCLTALRTAADRLPRGSELAETIVVADGVVDDPTDLVREVGARLLKIEGPSGPAVARSRGAEIASGGLLVFVDSDVVVHEDALIAVAALFGAQPGLGAAFGAYDEGPADPGFFSQCRNLAHSFIHKRSQREAHTFWAGLGAVRAQVFAAVGGFDPRFAHPSVEDIDLGYRIRAAGFSIVLDPSIQGTHLKRWTLWSSIKSDVRDRGIPWAQLLSRYSATRDDLNVTIRYRACVVLAYLLVACIGGALVRPALAWLAPLLIAGLWWLDHRYYTFLVERKGWSFTLRWFPFHILHHLCNGFSFAVGTLLYATLRWTGVSLPGALPLTAWSATEAAEPRGRYLAH